LLFVRVSKRALGRREQKQAVLRHAFRGHGVASLTASPSAAGASAAVSATASVLSTGAAAVSDPEAASAASGSLAFFAQPPSKPSPSTATISILLSMC